MTVAVIPCSAAKLDRPAPARELYRGPLFRSALLCAEALRERGRVEDVLVLSALHGLVELGTDLAPYDVTWGDADAIPELQLRDQLDVRQLGKLLPLLPKGYHHQLARAAGWANIRRRAGWLAGYPIAEPGELDLVELLPNPLAGSRGVLDQRGRLRQLREAVPA